VSVISIVETMRDLFSPSLGGISSVPIATVPIFSSFRKRRVIIWDTSTAVVIACPRAFNITSLEFPDDIFVRTART